MNSANCHISSHVRVFSRFLILFNISNSFNKSTIIYTYGSELDVENEVYYYSETKPEEERKYFYLDKDNIPHIWYTASVLFIGNSFTYYVGSEEDPRVPKYFKSIANNLNQMVDIDYVVKGSHTLAKFSSSSDPYGNIVEEKHCRAQYAQLRGHTH